ncbi:Ubiquitin specific peptidase 46 [Fasciola hepatica]|nr:Ubiquitin specific peptidase 46 [Fasciola hepatica]
MRLICCTMGLNSSQLEKEIADDRALSSERYFGLVNFGNTCYCNSVLQALFFCKPFRDRVLHYRQTRVQKKETLLSCLADLFHAITTQKKSVGQIAPKKFINKLKRENGAFDNYLQQDAHEFLIYILNEIADILQAEQASGVSGRSPNHGDEQLKNDVNDERSHNWIQEIFQGCLTNETRCLTCENVRIKDEHFLDLSVDVAQDWSIFHCLKCFSDTETMQSENKYYCEFCRCKQEAQKRMRVKRPPLILALHLKRFKYSEEVNSFTKLSCPVTVSPELRLPNTSDCAADQNWLYKLIAVVVHSGSGPNRGHYLTLVKSHGLWLLFDDEVVDKVPPSNLEDFFGQSTTWTAKSAYTAYILFYQASNFGSSLSTPGGS